MPSTAQRFFENLRLGMGAAFSFNQKRLCLGIGLFVALVCTANYEFGWFFSPANAKRIVIASFVMPVLFHHFVSPSFQEVQDYRDRERGE
jgi:hypothetical protein